jgi:hypothetical protein
MIDEKLLLQEAKKRKIEVTEREIRDGVNSEYFQAELKKQSLTEADFEKRVQDHLMVCKLIDTEVKLRLSIPDEQEIKNLYDQIVAVSRGITISDLSPEAQEKLTEMAKFFLRRDGKIGSYSKLKKELSEYIYRSDAEIVFEDFLKRLRSNATIEVAEIE